MSNKNKDDVVKSSAMSQVINHLLVKPHSCAELVQKIGIYSSSHISRCLRKLKKDGLIDAVWNPKLVCLVYYNLKLKKDDQYSEENLKAIPQNTAFHYDIKSLP